MQKFIATTAAALIGLFYPVTANAANGALSVLWRYGSTNVHPGQVLKVKEVVKTGADGKVFGLADLVNAKITINPNSRFSVEVSRKNRDGSINVVVVFQEGSGRVSVPPRNNPKSTFYVISPRQGLRQISWVQACSECRAVIDPSSAVKTRIDALNNATTVFVEQAAYRTVGVVKGKITEMSGGAIVPMTASMYVRYRPGQIPVPRLASRSLAAHNLKIFPDQSVLVGVNPGNKIIQQGIDLGEQARLLYGSLFTVANPLGDRQDYYVGLSRPQTQTHRFPALVPDEVARGAGQEVY
jgi:hypothetical protein